MTRALAASCLLFAASGCYVHREYERNAPGVSDILKPPAGRLEVPRDTGRHGVLLSGGLLGGGGRDFGGPEGNHGSGALQLELSAAYFSTDRGLSEDAERLPPLTGMNFGYTLAATALTRHMLYAEVQRSAELLGVAGGWMRNPTTGAHGPQATLFYGPLYLRLGWVFDRGGEAQFGLALKGYAKLSWFR